MIILKAAVALFFIALSLTVTVMLVDSMWCFWKEMYNSWFRK